jgi:hypothetical protein
MKLETTRFTTTGLTPKRVAFDAWDGRPAWQASIGPRYCASVQDIRDRARDPLILTGAELECYDSGRPFSFMRNLDLIERVRMRNAWERMRNGRTVADWGI